MSREVRRSEIKPCALCRKPLMHTGVPLFWRVTVERFGVDAQAVRTVAGLETHFGGNTALANVFAGDPAIGKSICEPVHLLVCEDCILNSSRPIGVAALMEIEARDEAAEEDQA